MFGYVTINKPELKIREFEMYQSWYCGLCESLRRKYGVSGQVTLSYDMTFLVMVLQGVYEEAIEQLEKRCIVHPLQKHVMRISKFSEYAADMNILLAYYNFQDDWQDEKKLTAFGGKLLLEQKVKKLSEKYPRQKKTIVDMIHELSVCEASNEMNIDKVSGYMGKLLGDLFVYEDDIFQEHLYGLGFFLGKFIYLMDAYEDVKKDLEKGLYNPFVQLYKEPDFETKVQDLLNMMMTECAVRFEKLPILENVEILRNIIYSGVWMKHALIYNDRHHTGEEKKNDRSV